MYVVSSGREERGRPVDKCSATSNKDSNAKKTTSPLSFSLLLKQVHQYHNRKIRELNSKLTHVQRQLQEVEISNWDQRASSTQYVFRIILFRNSRCPNCENGEKLLKYQMVKYEKKLKEKDIIINKLQQQLRNSEFNVEYPKKRRLEFDIPDKCEEKLNVMQWHKTDSSDFTKVDHSNSDFHIETAGNDNASIKNMKQDFSAIGICQNNERDAEKLITETKSQNSLNLGGSALVKCMLVPETAVEEIYDCQSEVVILETLVVDTSLNTSESPVIASNFPRINISEAVKEEKLNTSNSSPKHDKGRLNSNFLHSTPYLYQKDLDKSIEEFEEVNMKRCPQNVINTEGKSRQSLSESNPVSKPKEAVYPKLRVLSPSSKYKLHFQPATKDHKRVKYKQTTLTQSMLNVPLQAIENVQEKDLQRALAESLKEACHSGNSIENKSDFNEIVHQQLCSKSDEDTVINHRMHEITHDNQLHIAKDNSLDSTFVSTLRFGMANRNEPSDSEVCEEMIISPKFAKFNESEVSTAPHHVVGPTRQTEHEVEVVKESYPNNSEDLLQEIGKQSPRHSNLLDEIPVTVANSTDGLAGSVHMEQQYLDDFDVVPKKHNSPKYKYKQGAVRQQDERRKIDGHECRECANYFGAMQLSDEEKRKRLKICSRHREKYPLPDTPEHFWSVQFPATQECKERGVMNNTQYRPLQRRRNRK